MALPGEQEHLDYLDYVEAWSQGAAGPAQTPRMMDKATWRQWRKSQGAGAPAGAPAGTPPPAAPPAPQFLPTAPPPNALMQPGAAAGQPGMPGMAQGGIPVGLPGLPPEIAALIQMLRSGVTPPGGGGGGGTPPTGY